jgi:hypothetical protein
MDRGSAQKALEERARGALALYRASAFDNVDVAAFAAAERLPLEKIRWIGRRLALSARSTGGFQEGREIAAAAEALMKA